MERSPELSSVILPTCFHREVDGPPVRGKVQPVLRVRAIPELCPEGSLALSVQTPAHHQQRLTHRLILHRLLHTCQMAVILIYCQPEA